MNDIVIIALVCLSAVRALVALADNAGTAPVAITLTLLAVGALGILAVQAMVQNRTSARGLVSAWATAVLAYVVVADLTLGFLRPGLPGRLAATALIAALLAAIVVSVHRPADASLQARASRA